VTPKDELMDRGYSASAADWILTRIEQRDGSLDFWLFRALDLLYVKKINEEHP
jgi:hypothetical protein